MLSSQQRLLLRAIARRRLPPSRIGGLHQQQHTTNSPLVVNTSSLLFHSTSRRDDDKPMMMTRGIPSIQLGGRQSLLSTSILERSYPMGLSPRPQLLWFSTTANDDDKKGESYRERAARYRERASEYGDKAKEGAESFGGMMKQYGPTFFGTYLGVYVATLGALYLGVESGALDPVTMLGYITGNHEEIRTSAEVVAEQLEHYTVTAPFADVVKEKPHLANFAIAWIATKFTEPFRFGGAVMLTPRVARYFNVTPQPLEDDEDQQEEKATTINENSEAAKTEEAVKKEDLESKAQEETKKL